MGLAPKVGSVRLPPPPLGVDPKRLEAFAPDELCVVYCAGPHCNGALRPAELGRPVKEMIGGVTGWKDEGFLLVTGGRGPTTRRAPANLL